ncbi:MAG: DNA polymerase III subunit gamma/tau [Alphaproteobacteria bacterium]|nr:DNA polymerase III subunit gamma/tau [Alphaproteobacteria bacterium]
MLSRKYRPKVLDDLIGQDILARSLRSCLDTKKVPHAFLFHGIRGVGKTTTARILARCLCCTGVDGKTDVTSSPCGTCRSCIAMDKDQHMDVMEFDAASRTGVDDIREVIDAAQYMPVLGRYKIFIIDEVHMLSKSAFNALLKTLEEPPAHVKFIFATTEIHKIPETILSRCMTFQLSPVSATALSNYLVDVARKEGFILEQAAANTISEEAEGSVRDALSILEQATMLADNAHVITADTIVDLLGGASSGDIEALLELILDAKTTEALVKSEELMAKGADPFVIFKNLQGALYRGIVDKVGGKLAKYSLSNLLYLWQIFLKQTENMKNSAYPKYVLNAAIIILAHTASFPDIEKLMVKVRPEDETAAQQENAIAQDNSKRLINDVLNKFPGSVAREVE